MTPFEQQVAAALASGLKLEIQRDFCAYLAPRVAAAIQATKETVENNRLQDLVVQSPEDAALAALRGEP